MTAAYVELARCLPAPTAEQARAFARFITGAHSWYKHLRNWGEHPSVFYLDPNAGRRFVRRSDTDVTFLDVAEGERAFHYSAWPTAAYRLRFGHWNYAQAFSTSFQVMTAQGLEDTAGSRLQVLSPAGQWIPVPDDLAAAGTAGVNALMYWPDSRGRETLSMPAQDQRLRGLFLPLPSPAGSQHYLGWVDKLDETLPALSAALAQPLRSLIALWRSAPYGREFAEVGQPLAGVFDRALAQHERDRLFDQVRTRWDTTASRAAELKLFQPLIAALDAERERQIGLMIAAMERFAAALAPR